MISCMLMVLSPRFSSLRQVLVRCNASGPRKDAGTLLNTVVSKASRSPELADAISAMFDDESQRKKLVSPLFYLRVLAA